MSPKDARDAVVIALHRAGLSAWELCDLDVEDVCGRRGLRPTLTIERRSYVAHLTFDRLEILALQAWLRHRGSRPGALVLAVHVDRVGRRPLDAQEVAQILERGRTEVRRRRPRPVEPDEVDDELDAWRSGATP